ncbi:hypothetical protein A2Z10_03095 [Candidatus Azambacteria bacterium RBG_16_47_10]|uniref:Adenylate kinase n=1 Tax=Candidatus Azambacteria bacterium RBG_16_47_10 TaxID=1797292 RepID=A0A1F5AYK8_9BACT|nr:MAG: hypothetical protein A2Z10_03095 [Candidatus Azambacteria bacterium RBG_16_47_10]
MEKKPLNIIMLGRSGSGKGTQAQMLVQDLSLEYIGTGDLLRKFSERDNAAARRMKETMTQGKLAPSWMPFFIWMEKLAYTDINKGVLFDGSPRMLQEAKTLDEVLEWFERDNIKVILIDIPREVAYERLMKRRVCDACKKGAYVEKGREMAPHCLYCGGELTIRSEDYPEAIASRLDWYDTEVVKVVEYYHNKGKLITISGEKAPEEIHEELLAALKESGAIA